VPTTPVVVAARDIPARTRITAEMLEVRPVPQDLVSAKAFTRSEDVVGKVARFPMVAREQVTADKLVETSLGVEASRNPPLAVQVPPGKRAVAIAASEETAAGGLVLPGDFVDVIGVFEVAIGPDGQDKRTVSVVVVQNVQVLAIGQKVTDLPPGAADLPPAERVNLRNVSPDAAAKTMTLSVSPEEALALALAAEKGSLRVALRSFTDTNRTTARVMPPGVLLPPEIAAILLLNPP
jgi:pilus assembly protein CpaB